MKVSRNFLTALYGVIMLAICGTATGQTDEFNLNETYSIAEDGTIELQSNDADIAEIRGTDRSDVHVMVHYRLEVDGLSIGKREKFAVEVTERNGDLVINEKPRNVEGFNLNLGTVDEKYTITVEAPAGVNLSIDGDDDTYEITGMQGAIEMNSDDSEITLRNCTGNDFRFNFDDGELAMDSGSGSLQIDLDDGEADIRNGRFDWVDIDMDDADVDLSTALADDGNYDFSSDDGDIEFTVLGGGGTFRIDHDDIHVSVDSNFEVIREDENYNEYRLAGGNARVDIDTDDGDVRLSTQ